MASASVLHMHLSSGQFPPRQLESHHASSTWLNADLTSAVRLTYEGQPPSPSVSAAAGSAGSAGCALFFHHAVGWAVWCQDGCCLGCSAGSGAGSGSSEASSGSASSLFLFSRHQGVGCFGLAGCAGIALFSPSETVDFSHRHLCSGQCPPLLHFSWHQYEVASGETATQVLASTSASFNGSEDGTCAACVSAPHLHVCGGQTPSAQFMAHQSCVTNEEMLLQLGSRGVDDAWRDAPRVAGRASVTASSSATISTCRMPGRSTPGASNGNARAGRSTFGSQKEGVLCADSTSHYQSPK